LTGDGRSFTFLRPGDPLGGPVPSEEAERDRMRNAWARAKVIISNSLSGI
jgi:hypothetical protein